MRKNRAPLIAASLLAALAGAAGLYYVLEDPGPGGGAAVAGGAERARPAHPAGLPDERADLRDATSSGGEPRTERASVVETEPDTAPFSLDDAHWFDVTVARPLGTPPDEELRLFATSYGEGVAVPERKRGLDAMFVAIDDETKGDVHARTEKNVARVECERSPNGTFRAPFAADAAGGVLSLEGHYLHMEDLKVDPEAAGALRLEPQLGGRLQVRLQLPALLPAWLDPEELGPVEVQLMGWTLGSGRDSHHARAEVAPGGEADLGGLPVGMTYMLRVESSDFTSINEMGVPVEAGVATLRELTLAAGAMVRGRVLDPSGAPLAGAEVSAQVSRSGMVFGMSEPTRETETDDEGNFELRAVSAGTLELGATMEGFADSEALELEVSDLQLVEGLTLSVTSGNRVTGILLWPDGKPAASESVTLVESVSSGSGRRNWRSQENRNVTTGDDGRFVVGGLGAGPFELRAEAERLETSRPKDSQVALTQPMGTWSARMQGVQPGAEVELRLEPAAVLRGVVVDDLGEPVANFDVVAREPSGGDMPWQRSRESKRESFETADGAFEFARVGHGTWTITAESEGHGPSEPVEVSLPGHADQLVLSVPRSAVLSGLVREPSGALAVGATVTMRPPGQRGRWMGGEAFEAECDESGAFRFEDVTPASYSLFADTEGFAPSEALTLEVLPASAEEGVVLDLRVGGTLTGEIYADDGSPDGGRSIMLQQPLGGQSESASSDSAGQFRIDGLAPGSWQVVAMPDMSKLDGDDVDQAELMSQLKMNSVEIVDGGTTHVVLGAPPADPVELTGRVTLAGEPVAGDTVMAFAEGEGLLSKMKVAKTDEDGRFALTLPAPGAWVLTVGSNMGSDNTEFPVSVPAAESHHVELEIPRGRISGIVLGPDGAPREGVRVSLRSESGSSMWSMSGGRNASSDDQGRFDFDSVRAGVYSLRAGGASPFFGNSERPEFSAAAVGGLVVEENGAVDGVELRLSEPGTLRGVVRTAGGGPAVDATVYVRDASGLVLNPMSWVLTDAKGAFRYDAAAPGSYTVSARSAEGATPDRGPFEVAAGAETEVELVLEAATTLRITVEDDEGELVRASVRVVDDDGRVVSGFAGTADQALLLSEGISTTIHRVGPLAPGRYVATATHADGRSTSKSVTLRGQDERNLRMRLRD